jgi:ABC-type transport system substrate-binding protein
MKKAKLKAILLVGTILTLFVSSTYGLPKVVKADEPFFTLVAKTNGGGVRPDYLNFLKQHLARININVNVQVLDWPSFVMELLAFRNFDICYVALTGGGADPDMTGVYNENGSLNLFGYDTSMDYNTTLGTGVNEWFMKQGNLIMPPDSSDRVQHYWAWEQYLMDKILPCAPTFAPKAYTAIWSNLQGYNISDGIMQSWGKMYWDGSHDGQTSTNEFVIRDAAWSDLNPLFQDDASSALISGATLDPLIFYDADLTVWPHIAKWWKMINDTHVRINIREGIKWQLDPDGTFPDEYVDIEDVYFTLYAWATVSNDVQNYEWIKDMQIVNDTCMDVFIDGDPDTAVNDPYAPFLPLLSANILPEHYLNQTQEADGVTPDINHPSWTKFATHCFGTGIFESNSFTEGVETTLTEFGEHFLIPGSGVDLWGINAEERFGNFTVNGPGLVHPSSLRIRIIPDAQTGLLEFEAGKIDLIGVNLFPEKRDAYLSDPDFEVQSDTQFYFGFFGYNMREVRGYIGSRNPCPGDPTMTIGLAVRKAISYAIDRNEMNNVIHKGEYTITDFPIYLKQGIWCNPNIIRYNHDLDLAREYMEIAGFVTNPTDNQPGFTLIITLVSIMLIATASFIIRKRRK